MRRTSPPPAASTNTRLHIRQTLRTLFPYLWQYRGRILAALACLVLAKIANVGVPLVFKEMIDSFADSQLVLPVLLLSLYGVLRFSTSLFTELREILFARVTQRVIRRVALEVFQHLHNLSLRFHLARQTGGISRDLERGTRSISSLISYTLYSILPTLIEVFLVLGILFVRYDIIFVLITLASLTAYVVFTVKVSNWRINIRRAVNENDSAANSRAIDSLINYETVKYFNNEHWEAQRYDDQLVQLEAASVRSQTTLAYLNLGQQGIIALGVTAMMWHAAAGVVDGSMTIGDLVLVNAFLIQLYIPMNFLGIVYREIRQALADIERMFALLGSEREIVDRADAQTLSAHSPVTVEFCAVDFAYDSKRTILHGISFQIPAGKNVAVVGASGSGKSTLARLLYRFYDVQGGSVRINGEDIRNLTQDSLRAAIGIVPQDTVLFNESILYNIRYGRPEASDTEVYQAAQAAHLHQFIESLPDGYQTQVGERGLKLSGGEKQRVAIARALLKNPQLLIFDEATSALDSNTERAIQSELELASRGRTSLIIAHRLSTIMLADNILVMDNGQIIEQGRHSELLARGGTYARMWALQQQENPD